MLLWCGSFVGLGERDQMVVPVLRIRMALVAYFIENVVQIIDDIDYLSHVRLLYGCHCCNRELVCFDTTVVTVRIPVDAINIIIRIERVSSPWVIEVEASLF